jgi:hypothetical protein
MATLGDLKTRIISETLRDDLADDLAAQFTNIIAKSIEQYASEAWWFNERRALIPTVAGQNYVTWPADCNRLDGLFLEMNNGNSRWPITARSIDEFERLSQPGTTGQPTDYLVTTAPDFSSIIKLFPIPNAIWNLAADYIADVTPGLVLDGDSNFWTNAGQDLITAQAKIRLYRDYLSATSTDPRLMTATLQEKDAYSNLRAQSTRRQATGRLMPSW